MSDSTPTPRTSAALPWREGIQPDALPVTLLSTAPDPNAPGLATAYPLGWAPRTTAEVDASWLRQVTLVDIAGVTVRLQARLDEPALAGVAGDQHADRPQPEWPLTEPVLVIGAVRGPSVVHPDEAIASRDELVRQLEQYGVAATPAWTVDRGHRWVEPSVVAFADPAEPRPDWQERALGIARQAGVGTVVQVAQGQWTVLSLGALPSSRYSAVASAPASLTRDAEHRCPMQAAPARGEYCSMRGGPWTGSSIRASLGWQAHRDLLIDALGCDTCGGERYQLSGRVFIGGGPIPLVPTPMPTRWLQPDETALEGEAGHDRS